ncbi:hypothetical protein GCM10010236_08290 [Streptomyces eurythermus]|nr:hypothetical protein GCM10010236_08290 [Streptomyces eurythermus]
MPDELWEIAKPLVPGQRTRPQGGGTANTPDETLFAAIIYVLVSGCVWRALPPCFGVSKSTAHRRFLIWSRAGVWGRLHEAVLHRLDGAGLIDVTRVVLDTAHVGAEKRGRTHTGPSPVDQSKPGSRMHILSDANGLPLVVGVSAAHRFRCLDTAWPDAAARATRGPARPPVQRSHRPTDP